MRKRSEQIHGRESSATLQLTVSLLYQTPTMSIDKHKTPSYNEYTICKFHTLPKCTITTEGSMIFLHKSEKGHKLTLFSQK